MNMHKHTKTIYTFLLAAVMIISVPALANWSYPSAPPADCVAGGCRRPLNVGSISQIKNGSLIFGDQVVAEQYFQVLPLGGVGVTPGIIVSREPVQLTPGVAFDINGSLRIRGGSPGLGKVLTSLDTAGQGVWSEIGVSGVGTPAVDLRVRPAGSLTATDGPLTIALGTAVVLEWTATNATACWAAGSWAGTKNTSGSQQVSPNGPGSFIVTCSNSSGAASDSVAVHIN